MSAWNSYVALRLDQQPASSAWRRPHRTLPRCYELTPSTQPAVVARLRLLARVYLLTGRLEPAVAGLSAKYEREEAGNRRREEARLVDAEVAADSTTEAEEAEEQVAEAGMAESDVRDDNVRHEQPMDAALMAALAQTSSTDFDFPADVAPPSSQHAVSTAARLLFLNPTSAENWQLMADSAEGREVRRRRYGGDSDAGWQAAIHCRRMQYDLLQERASQPPLWPHDIAADSSADPDKSSSCLLSSVYCTAHLRDDAAAGERLQRSTSMASTLDSVPADTLSTPFLRWLHARCQARLAVHDGDRAQAMQHYQRCVELSGEDGGGRLPGAAIWQEISEVLHPEGSELALQSGLRWLDQSAEREGHATTADRSALVLSLLDLYQRTEEFGKGADLLRAEYAFLLSQRADSTSTALALSVLLCDSTERSASSRSAYMKEVKALQPLWQERENELVAEPARRWEQPLPARTRWHLAQLAAYQKEWEAALSHLQAVDDPALLTGDAYKEALDEAFRRVREAAQSRAS